MSELPYLRMAGHARLREALARAWRTGRLPQTLLLHGPRGVGKQRLALWLAALIHCEARANEPCGRCTACHLTGRLAHPDLHWFFPTPRPRGADTERLRGKFEELRAAELEARRKNPAYTRPRSDEPLAIHLAAAQNLRALLAVRPASGRFTVAIIGDAETLVPQEASPEAANALLKSLEEPPPTAYIILTTHDPRALLPTLRSRCHPLLVPPLPEDEIARYLHEELHVQEPEARKVARIARGSIGRALELLDKDAQELHERAHDLLRAALDPDPAARFAAAHAFRLTGGRGTTFLRILDELQLLLRDRLAAETRTGSPVSKEHSPETAPEWRNTATAAAILAVEDARGMAERNLNPQLVVAGLLQRLHILLRGPEAEPLGRGPRGSRAARRG